MGYLTAAEIMEQVKEKIISLPSQKNTLNQIASLLSLHGKRLAAMEQGISSDFLPRFSQLLIAPTGSGKTYLISKLAEAAGLPFHSIDCSVLTLSGYKGLNLGDALNNLREHTHSTDFENSVILFDEFDKCAFRFGESGNVQPNFLKLLEGSSILCGERMMDTSKMLFLFAGAFQGLDQVVEQRSQKKSIGFAMEEEKQSQMMPTMDDVESYGFNRELLGRIGSLHIIPKMAEEDYFLLLNEGKTSVQEKYRCIFAADSVCFSIDEKACQYITKLAVKRNMGARAVDAIVGEQLRQAFVDMDNRPKLKSITLTEANAHFCLCYKEGKKTREKPVKTAKKMLYFDLESDRSINELCSQLMHYAGADELLYHFFQTVLRYLSLESLPADATVHSLHLLAKAVASDIPEGGKTSLDVMMDDVRNKAENSTAYSVLLHHYYQFKALEKDNMKLFLMAVQIACDRWEKENC